MEISNVDHHLDLACQEEALGNKDEAEKQWKFAVFCEARVLGISPRDYIADCCPVY